MSLADCIRREKGTKEPAEVETLCLDQAKCVDGLAPLAPFSALLSLSIQDAGISSLDTLPALDNLTELKLSDNKIKGGLENLLRLPKLERLYLAANQIPSLEELEKIAKLDKLELLDLEGNPVTKVGDYSSSVFAMFSSLIALDGKNRDGDEIEEDDDDDDDDDEDDDDEEGDDDDAAAEERPKKKPKTASDDDDDEGDEEEGDDDDDDDEDEDDEDEEEEGAAGGTMEYTAYGDILGAGAEAYQEDDNDAEFEPGAEPDDFEIPEDEEVEGDV